LQLNGYSTNVVEDHPPFFDAGGDRLEPIVAQDDGRRLLRGVSAACAHRHAHVGLAQRRRVVDAVSEHRHDFAACLQRLDDAQLVFGRNAAEYGCMRRQCLEVLFRQARELAPLDDAHVALQQAELAPDRPVP
jgi:hypothetical protein